MAQFKILECDESGTTKYYAVKIEIVYGWHSNKIGIADCVVCEYSDLASTWEIVSVDPDELYEAVKKLEDEIIEAM